MKRLMTLLSRRPTQSASGATRTTQKMSDTERQRELDKLREPKDSPPTSEQLYYRQRLQRMRDQGIPVRLNTRNQWQAKDSKTSPSRRNEAA